MADTTTSWILELIDHITKPGKMVQKQVKKMTEGIDAMTDTVRLNEKDTKKALENSRKHYKDLEGSIRDVEKELKELERVKKNGSWNEQMQAGVAYDNAKAKLDRYRKALQGADRDIEELTTDLGKFQQKNESWTDLATGINQGVELIQKAADGLDFSVEVQNLTTEIQRMTDVTGPALDEMVSKTRHVAKVYEEDAKQIAIAANAMSKQIGGTFEENIALIEEGFKKGANINGDFLDQLREYPTFIKQLGLSQSQAIALIAQSGKEGIFSDKGIDALKEGNLALREMQQIQVDALAGIGLKPDDIVGKTPFEAMQLITSKMKDMAPQARQMILTDLFKGAGEDAGLAFIEGLSDMDLDLTKLPSVEQAGAGIKGFFADISTWAGQTFGSIGIYAQQLAPIFQTIAAGIPIMQALTKATWLQQAAQWALNIAMDANPIGLIIIAIAALIALVVVAIKHYEDWGAALLLVMGPLGLIVNLVQSFIKHWDSIEEAFEKGGIVAGLKRIGLVLLDALLYPVQQLLELLSNIPGLGHLAAKGAGFIAEMRHKLELDTNDKKKEQEEKEETPSVNAYTTGTPEVLGKATTKGKNKREGNGLNVGSGSGGIKSITMTLDIKNYFNVGQGTDMRKVADQIVGQVNDRMRDAVINLGG